MSAAIPHLRAQLRSSDLAGFLKKGDVLWPSAFSAQIYTQKNGLGAALFTFKKLTW